MLLSRLKILIMKKTFILVACAMLSASVFAQTPQTVKPTEKSKPATHATVKKDKANTQNSKEALSKDKEKMKTDKEKNASAQTKKADKQKLKSDKATVKANKKTEKQDKKTVAKKTSKKTPASTSTGSLSTPPKQ